MLQFPTAIGSCGLTWSEAGITAVSFPGDRALKAPSTEPGTDIPGFVHDAVAGIQALMNGDQPNLNGIRLDPSVIDDYTRRVLDATRAVPPGETTTYGAIARAIGTPQDARAVGAALGRNPYPILVPCHRVLAADGSLHGFSAPGGITTKRQLLEIERAPGFDQPSLFG